MTDNNFSELADRVYKVKDKYFTKYTSIESQENDIVNETDLLIPPGIYLFKVNSRNTRARSEICSS